MKESIYILVILALTLLLAACGTTEAATGQSNFVTATSTASLILASFMIRSKNALTN